VDSEVWKEFETTARRLSEPYYVVWVLLGLVPSFIVIGVLSADEHDKVRARARVCVCVCVCVCE